MTPSPSSTLLDTCRKALLVTLADFARDVGFSSEDALQSLRDAVLESHDELAGLKDRRGFETARGLTASRISLVHEDDLEFSIRLSELARRLRERCENELGKLHQRYMTLLDQSDAVLEQLPIGTETVCCGLRGLSDGAGLSPSERLTLLERIETALGNRLYTLYVQTNRELEAAGVTPKSLARNDPAPSAREISNRSLNESVDASGGSIVELHRTLLSRQTPGSAATQIDPELAASLLERVLGWLTEQQVKAASDNMAGKLVGSELGPLLSANARAAVEAIERVFEAVIAHPRLPQVAKQAFERLRIPLLKLALVDEGLLRDPHHPARRLLDAMADATIGLMPDTPATHPVCRCLDEAALQIQHGFKRDAAVFSIELERILTLTPTRQDMAAKRTTSYAEPMARVEREELCLRFASRAVRALCSESPPLAVRGFLERHWIPVLVATLLAHGEKSSEWRNQLTVADRLIWSVQPKTDGESRQQLLRLLPELLKRIHAGLARVGIDTDQRNALLAPCMALHSAALHGRATAADETPYSAALPEIELEAVPDVSGLRVLRIRGWAEREPAIPPAVTSLVEGDWLEVALPDGRKVRGCIGKISSSRQVFLLVDPDRQGVLGITARALVRQWTNGVAQNLAESPLFERAAEHALRTARGGR